MPHLIDGTGIFIQSASRTVNHVHRTGSLKAAYRFPGNTDGQIHISVAVFHGYDKGLVVEGGRINRETVRKRSS